MACPSPLPHGRRSERGRSQTCATFPQVASFNLPSTLLPPPASLPGQSHHCLVALIHSTQDPFTSTQTNVDALAIADRKVAQRNLELVAFVGTPPSPQAEDGAWSRLDLYGSKDREWPVEIVIDARSFRGRLGVLLPPDLQVGDVVGLSRSNESPAERWARKQTEDLRRMMEQGRYN